MEATTRTSRSVGTLSVVMRWALATLLLLQTALPVHAGSRVTYYINDALGSPAATLDEAGAVIERADYLPYGGSTDTSGNASTNAIARIGYTGHVQDDTGLVYMGARYFDPVAGRFMSMDPVGFDEANPQSFNRYQYANNNPYRYVDPDGRESIDIQFADSDGSRATSGQILITVAGTFSPLLMHPGIAALVAKEAAAEISGIDLFSLRGLLTSGAKISTKRITELADSNITNSKITVLGHFPGYIEKAKDRGASFFDIGDVWDSLTDTQRWAANKRFLDRIAGKGDQILLSLPKTKIRPGSYLEREIQYSVKEKGYRWINQWSLKQK
ncbi:MAG: RHS repeat-associated core domain-containing protein [Gammaproteobacteria bacterium]|nr:RHS repeat-associated core domain-containing protein [Gammaproteobacteria bacterium]